MPKVQIQTNAEGTATLIVDGKNVSTGTPDFIGTIANQFQKGESLEQMQTRVANQGRPGFDVFGNPVASFKSPDGAVSSNDALTSRATDSATGAAASALSTSTDRVSSGGFDFFRQRILEQQRAGQESALATSKENLRLFRLESDLAKEQSNFVYGNQIKQLRQQHDNAVQAADSLASQLNPFADPRLSSTTQGFTEKIHSIYQDKEQTLRQQADFALRAIEINDAKAFTEAQRNMNAAIATADQQAFDALQQLEIQARKNFEADRSFGLEVSKEETDEEQFNKKFGLDIAKFQQDKVIDALQAKKIEAEVSNIYSQIRSRQIKDGDGINVSQHTLPLLGPNKETILFTPRKDLTAAQKNAIPNITTAVNLINEAEAMYALAAGAEYEGRGGTALSRLKGVSRFISTVTGVGADPQKWTTYKDYVRSRRALIAKGIMGEVGNLAQQEQINAALAFPTEFNTPQEAEAKFDAIRQQVFVTAGTLGDVQPIEDDGSQEGPEAGQSNNTVTFQGRTYLFPTPQAAQEFKSQLGI